MKTGVLALQGSFYDHVQSLEFIDQDYVLIKDTSDLSNINSKNSENSKNSIKN